NFKALPQSFQYPLPVVIAGMIEEIFRPSIAVASEVESHETFGWALKLGNVLSPANLVEIQYSLPYCLAIAAIEGRGALAPISE
ncbi:hypothetical protein ACCS92_38380, partial [Rhizobium ruizarguesonis]